MQRRTIATCLFEIFTIKTQFSVCGATPSLLPWKTANAVDSFGAYRKATGNAATDLDWIVAFWGTADSQTLR